MTDRKATRSRLLTLSVALGLGAMGLISGCSSSDNATAPPATTTASSTPPPPTTPSSATGATSSLDGAALFTQNCMGCHGDKGAGGKKAPVLAGKHLAEADVTKIVTSGKGRMPSFKTRLKEDQISAIGKYVASL